MEDRLALGARFGEEHFGAAQLGDLRRTKRLVQLADKMVMHPGGTLPDKIDDPASLKALYRLVDQEEVTHATVLAPSRTDIAADAGGRGYGAGDSGHD